MYLILIPTTNDLIDTEPLVGTVLIIPFDRMIEVMGAIDKRKHDIICPKLLVVKIIRVIMGIYAMFHTVAQRHIDAQLIFCDSLTALFERFVFEDA